MLKNITGKRRIIQSLFAVAVYTAVAVFGFPLLWVIAAGAALGLLFGKVFCRWMCPIGLIIELLLNRKGKGSQQMYMYHKLGCPIARISGLLNKSSIFNIQRDHSSCRIYLRRA